MASFSLCQKLAWLVYVELKYEDRVSSLSRDTSDVQRYYRIYAYMV